MGFLKLILRWVLLAFAITITSYILPFIEISGETVLKKVEIAFLAGLILGLVNTLIRPIIKVLAIPINILTLGLFNIFINAGMLWVVDYFVDNFKISGFWGYFWSSLLISIITVSLTRLLLYEKKTDKKNQNNEE
ncbi:MAG: phage holin family protein [Actinobacteria bacterium]|nr:phage holin family protein [Actinomycetota bacterium]